MVTRAWLKQPIYLYSIYALSVMGNI